MWRFILLQIIILLFTPACAEQVYIRMLQERLKSTPARAEQVNTKMLQEQFKSYLHAIKSIAVDFIQTDLNGTVAEGKLLINKPYKFRCNYYPPFPLLIVGNKNYVSVYDYQMEQVSRVKAQDNIFNFLLVDDAVLEKHFIFEAVLEHDNRLIITLYHKLSERRSNITFNKNTGQIEILEIFESDNIITLKFAEAHKILNFAEGLFELKNPDIFGLPARYNKAEIETKYQIIE